MERIKDQIDAQLIAKGMTQKQLAEQLNTQPSNFNKRLKHGKMRIGELERACDVLDLRITIEPK